MATFKRLIPEVVAGPRRAYPSDVTDAQWALLEPRLREDTPSGPGRPATVPLREIVNALLYIKQTGCPWRYLPHDLPPRSTVHYYFEKWTADGTLEEVNGHLREQSRRRAGRAAQATAGIMDSQTAKTADASQAVG
jgi:transposase